MYKYIVAFVLVLLLVTTKATHAEERQVAGSSAYLSLSSNTSSTNTPDYLILKKSIEKVLTRYNSPMAGHADMFIAACQKYSIDCYLLPSIAGLESQFGNVIYPGSYNPFGWGGGMIFFKNWNEGIMTVGKGLKENYINRGALTIEDIGHIYAPPSTTWASKVHYYHAQFEREEAQYKQIIISL